MVTAKGEIIHQEKFFDENQCVYYWQVTVRCPERPNLTNDMCEVVQADIMKEKQVKQNAKDF